MAEQALHGCRILVVEDEYVLAEELRSTLEAAGAVVLGPLGYLDDALALIAAGEQIDGAVLDVNLAGDMVFDAADRLIERGVPFVLTTGYDQATIPSRYDEIARCEKPLEMAMIVQVIERSIRSH